MSYTFFQFACISAIETCIYIANDIKKELKNIQSNRTNYSDIYNNIYMNIEEINPDLLILNLDKILEIFKYEDFHENYIISVSKIINIFNFLIKNNKEVLLEIEDLKYKDDHEFDKLCSLFDNLEFIFDDQFHYKLNFF